MEYSRTMSSLQIIVEAILEYSKTISALKTMKDNSILYWNICHTQNTNLISNQNPNQLKKHTQISFTIITFIFKRIVLQLNRKINCLFLTNVVVYSFVVILVYGRVCVIMGVLFKCQQSLVRFVLIMCLCMSVHSERYR